MAYTKNTWASGDVVTSAKLNNIENGIASGGVLVVGYTAEGDTITLNKTWNEINNASLAVFNYMFTEPDTRYPSIPRFIQVEDGDYIVMFKIGDDDVMFTCDSADGYPVGTFEE